MTQRSLKAHLKRSRYSLDTAIVSLRAALDLQKKMYITQNCKNLRRLEIRGSGVIGDSLTKSLPYAKSLNTLHVSRGCGITFSAVQECLKACRSTLTEATFLEVVGVMSFYQDIQLDHLKKFTLKTRRDHPAINIVSLLLRYPISIVIIVFQLKTLLL
jgi:F-box/TPR repeat protein Pof3